ncbi:MAG TPA: NHLP family bacteriocin export ABC transporter permease/ATPase subunit, partial [Firmicutes bacterium]|nr:NHLP family bacteriocin export ABC transporter permease/ATPase subunit [Bacillota bacterium]
MDATGREREVQLQSALEAIFDALSLPVPEVPEELEGLELRLDYMLRPYGVMRRRVELRGKWWLSTMGPLLGSTKAGDVVALLPAPYWGYTFVDPAS